MASALAAIVCGHHGSPSGGGCRRSGSSVGGDVVSGSELGCVADASGTCVAHGHAHDNYCASTLSPAVESVPTGARLATAANNKTRLQAVRVAKQCVTPNLSSCSHTARVLPNVAFMFHLGNSRCAPECR
jgi:hypothetical protein